MPHRYSSPGNRALIGALSFLVHCGAATAQGASPPPAVSVTPVVSRQVTETGEFIGRVTAIPLRCDRPDVDGAELTARKKLLGSYLALRSRSRR